MAITWGAFAGHLRVGIDFTHNTIGAGTTSVGVQAHFYVQVDSSWTFSDAQSLAVSGAGTANYAYTNTLGPNAQLKVGQYNFTSTVDSNGGPTFTFRATVQGHYQGAAPTHSRSFTTPASTATVPDAPTLTISQVTSNSAYVDVHAPANNGSPIVEYLTLVDNNADFSSPNDTFQGDGRATGLAAGTKYFVRARARNGIGWSPNSTTKSFVTGATVPSVPATFNIGTVGETTAEVNWTAPTSDGGSDLEDYTVQRADDPGFTVNLVSVEDLASPYTFTGLTPGKTYWARVRANNGVGGSAFTAAKSFAALTGTPTILTPANNSTVGTGIFDLTLTAGGINADRTITAQISSISDFTTNVKTVTLTPTGASSNNQYRLVDTGQYLSSGVWYARARVTNTATNYTTPWSSTVTFTQAHVPSVAVTSPTGGQIAAYGATTPFVFQFTDAASPNDWMTAYGLEIQDNATGAAIFTAAKTARTSSPGSSSITVNVAVPSSAKSTALRWRARAWDRADQASAWTGWAIFTLTDPPVVTITSPSSGLTVGTGSPNFSWTASFPSGGTQASATVQVYETDTQALIWSATTNNTNTRLLRPNTVILRNLVSYYVNITVRDSNGMQTVASRSFTTDYPSPSAVVYYTSTAQADSEGFVRVNWADANPDEMFSEWKVYRRTTDATEWTLLKSYPNQNTREHKDYLIEAGSTYLYSVTQVAIRSGVPLEGPVGYYLIGEQEVSETRTNYVELSFYWLINPENEAQNIRLLNVTDDSGTLEFEDATYNIIGRGRHRDYGDELGYTGTLTCQVKVPERPSQFRIAVEELRRSRATYVLRTPFGRIFNVALGNIGWTPEAGTGTSEMGELTIPYEEVR